MRKSLLIVLALGFGFTATAQNARVISAKQAPSEKVRVDLEKNHSATTPVVKTERPVRPVNANKSSVTVVAIGNAANAFGSIGKKTETWADPRINTVTVSHRATGAANTVVGPGSGYLWHDRSTDGGATWSINQGPIYSPTPTPPFSAARYPQGVIYNPTGNTTAANAFLIYNAAALSGTNGASWGALAYGAQKLDGVTAATQRQDESVDPYWYQVPFNMTVTQNGVVYIVDSADSLLSGSVVQTGNIWIKRGTWNSATSDIDYTKSIITAGGTQISAVDAAFNASGMIGYIGIIGHIDFTFMPDSVLYLSVWKTIDGGATWGVVKQINVSNLVHPILNSSANGKYNTGFDLDLSVDMNDDLHILCAVGTQSTTAFSVGTTPGEWGIFDVYTNDGGITYAARLIAKPHTFRGTFDPNGSALDEDSRAQISKTMDGSKLFYTYFDTDTAIFGSADGNKFPDMWAQGINIANGAMTPLTNMTTGSAADGQVGFGSVAAWSFSNAGTYTIPVSYQVLPADIATDMTELYYIGGASFNDNDFVVSVNEINNNVSIGSIYPNPVTENATIAFNLMTAEKVSVEIYNTLGAMVASVERGQLNAGNHQVTLNGTTLSNGLYFAKITAGTSTATSKFIVQ